MTDQRNKIFSIKCVLTLLGVFVLFQGYVLGQFLEKDTLNVKERYEKIKFTKNTDFYNFEKLDTTLHNLQYFNPVEKKANHFHWLSNLGQQHFPTVFQYNTGLRFDYGMNRNMSQYRYKVENVKYYFSSVPYTRAEYVQGFYKEQYFNVIHSQNIKDALNISVDYQTVPSQGQYARQQANLHNLALNTWYQHPNRRYNNWLTYVWNKNTQEQNGGIAADNVDDTPTYVRDGLAVFLGSAQRADSDRQIRFKQSFDGGFYTEQLMPDSTKIEGFHSTWRLAHTIAYKNERYHYQEADEASIIHPHTYLDDNITNDSILKKEYENEFALLLMGTNPFRRKVNDDGFRAKFALNHQYVGLQTINTGSNFQSHGYETLQNAWFSASVFNVNQKINYAAKIQVGLLGYNAGGLVVDGTAGYETKLGTLQAQYQSTRQKPVYFLTKLYTNHHLWDNDFKDEKFNALKFAYEHPKHLLDVSVNLYRLKDYVLLDYEQYSTQVDEAINIQQLHIHNEVTWRKWTLENDMTIQRLDSELLQFPNLLLRTSAYHSGRAFKKSMLYELGFIIQYNTDYAAPFYAPAVAQFYYPNYAKLGFYPVMDLFLNFKIRQVRFFVRTQHLSQGLFDFKFYSTYSSAPNYPMPDRSVKFGVIWQFYD